MGSIFTANTAVYLASLVISGGESDLESEVDSGLVEELSEDCFLCFLSCLALLECLLLLLDFFEDLLADLAPLECLEEDFLGFLAKADFLGIR